MCYISVLIQQVKRIFEHCNEKSVMHNIANIRVLDVVLLYVLA